jgi:hypothetical protein
VEERVIKGFGQLQEQLQMAQEALKSVEGQLGTVHFDPDDPESIERAMRQIDAIIEERLGDYLDNRSAFRRYEGEIQRSHFGAGASYAPRRRGQ